MYRGSHLLQIEKGHIPLDRDGHYETRYFLYLAERCEDGHIATSSFGNDTDRDAIFTAARGFGIRHDLPVMDKTGDHSTDFARQPTLTGDGKVTFQPMLAVKCPMMCCPWFPPNVVSYPEGTVVTGLRDAMDDDDGRERITPAGSEWRVARIDGDYRHIVCKASGATIIPTVWELIHDFRLIH